MKKQILNAILPVFFLLSSVCFAADLLVPSQYPTIQAGIDASTDGDTVIISPGIYTRGGNYNIDFYGKAITVRSTNPEDPCVVAATVINCQTYSGRRGFYFHSGETANSILSGLTIKNGRISSEPNAYGGGILCAGASPAIEYCNIQNNSISTTSYSPYSSHNSHGGGIACISGSNPIIKNCYISGNLARANDCVDQWCHAYGGGIYCSPDSSITVNNCIITGNTSKGGLRIFSQIEGITYPSASYGGGAYISQSGSTFKNCLITNNKTIRIYANPWSGPAVGHSEGGGIFSLANITVNNCTIAGNSTSETNHLYSPGTGGSGGGTYGIVSICNSIIWGNVSTNQIDGTAVVSYSDIQDGYAGTGNINVNPLFVNGRLGSFYLSQIASGQAVDSPCLNTGSDTAVNWKMDELTTRTDEIGDQGIVDMGYHYPPPIPNPADINIDGKVNFADFAIFASQWLLEKQSYDINDDGIVNFLDFTDFANGWAGDMNSLVDFVSQWLQSSAYNADIAPVPYGDGIVNFLDLAEFAENWLEGTSQ